MPCDNPKCSLYYSKNYHRSDIISVKEYNNCEFKICKKKFCSENCLCLHYILDHNFNNSKYFNISNDITTVQKMLLNKAIQNSLCGSFIKETLTLYKQKISQALNELLNGKNLELRFEDIENDYMRIEYFYYFYYKNFEILNTSTKPKSSKIITLINDVKANSLQESNFNSLSTHLNTVLGSGAFGEVYLAKNCLDGKLFAIKQMNKTKLKENEIDSQIIYREINTHFRLLHRNIARLYDYHEDKSSFYLIMEYVENGTLFEKIQKSNGLSEEKAFKYFTQVCSAISFLHDNHLIHRDIKPENCLIDKSDSVKLCDFGWTVEVTQGDRATFCGTYEYMAPEIIQEIPYNHMIDVWSLGILLYELIHSFSPFRV